MSRDPRIDMAMATTMLGLQQPDAGAGYIALALVMHTLQPWTPPTGTALKAARKAAARFRLSEDLAIFLPPQPGRFASSARKDAYRSLVIGLKRLDEMKGQERERTIAEVKGLMGYVE